MVTNTPSSAIKDPPRTFWKSFRFLGPSLILTATLVGSGELIVTTRFGAEAGYAALWVILCACVLKVAIQEALGRYTISSGQTALSMLDSLPGPRFRAGWAVWFWLAVIVLGSIQLGGIAEVVGQSLTLVFEGTDTPMASWGPRTVWAPIVCGFALLMLLIGQYRMVENVSMVVVSLFSLSIIFCGVLIQTTSYAVTGADIVSGLKFELPSAGFGMALAIVGAVGLSATELVYYPYWCLEKGYARWTGPRDESPQWAERAKGWIRVMQLDCYFALVVYTTTTVAFYFLGAAILNRKGLVPNGFEIVRTISHVYTETLGEWAYAVFLFSAFLVLFSTLFVTIASYGRLLPDCLKLLGVLEHQTEAGRKRWVRVCMTAWAVLFAVEAAVVQIDPLLKIVLGLAGLVFLLPVVSFAAIYLRYRRLDSRIQPSIFLDVWLWVSGILSVLLTIYLLIDQIQRIVSAA